MNKICTTIEQSKKLIELGIDVNTADMFWADGERPAVWNNKDISLEEMDVPAWSLAALLDQLEEVVVDEDGYEYKLQIIKEGVQYYLVYEGMLDAACYETSLFDDLIDCCYEMILKLKEKGLI